MISPVVQKTVTSDAEMSADFVDVEGSQAASAVTTYIPAKACQRLTTISRC
jgi:hypothetical protein